MKSRKFTNILLSLALLSLSVSSAHADGVAKSVTSADIQFEQIAPFVQMGAAWGNRGEGKHGTFGIFPGNAASPPHIHSGAYHGVVISGTMTNPFGDEKSPTKMGPGGYWYVPAGAEHVTACVSVEPCMFYFHAEGRFDFTPISN